MADQQLFHHRTSTPAHPQPSQSSGQSLPSDVLLQTCRRVHTVGLIAAGLWTLALIANTLVARSAGHPVVIEQLWPYPGVPVSLVGITTALLLVYLVKRLSRHVQLLLDVSAGFLVLTCLLVAILAQWVPPPISPRISWLCLLILSYPAIVPTAPGRTLIVSLVAASMEPLALGIAALRGIPFDHSPFYYPGHRAGDH